MLSIYMTIYFRMKSGLAMMNDACVFGNSCSMMERLRGDIQLIMFAGLSTREPIKNAKSARLDNASAEIHCSALVL